MLHFKIVFEYFYFVFFFPFNGKLEITRYKKTEYLFLHLYHQRVPISVPSICFETIQPWPAFQTSLLCVWVKEGLRVGGQRAVQVTNVCGCCP